MILCIETSTTKCSAALGRGKEILASREAESPEGGHAAALAPMVDELLKALRSHDGASLSAIAVSAGPGSYTGLRIGASLAKGLCLGYRVPLIAIDTLELLAHQAQCALPEGRTATLFPLLDARRMEVYAAEFTHTGERKQDDFAAILSPEAPIFGAASDPILIGNGATKARGLWPEHSYEVWDKGFAPTAEAMIALATASFEREDFVDTAYWTPNYLKDYVAVIAKNKVLNR